MSSLPIRTAQTIGITTAFLLSGCNLTIATILVPSLLHSPATLLLKQWNHAFQTGKSLALPLAAISALSYTYLAYISEDKTQVINYAVAGGLAIGIIPYTVIFMRATNAQLLERVDSTRMLGQGEELTEVGLPRGKSAHELVDWWGVLCLGTSVVSLAAGVWGAWVSLRREVA